MEVTNVVNYPNTIDYRVVIPNMNKGNNANIENGAMISNKNVIS